MNKHTSTPWDINWGTAHDGESHHIVDGKDFGHLSIIAMVKFHDDTEGETRANAHLIAAAPDLLAAAEWALKKLQCVPHLDDPDCYACGLNPLRIAIEKARGER